MHQQILDERERVLGKEHPDTLWSVHVLAAILNGQRNHKPALELYERAYSGFKKVFGKDHRYTIGCEKDYSFLLEKLNQ